jgi:hypothetical protein
MFPEHKMMQPTLCPSWVPPENQFCLGAFEEAIHQAFAVPAGLEAVPMEVDAGASVDNPGTPSGVLGTRPTFVVTTVFKDKGKGKMYPEVVPAYLRIARLVLRTLQPMEINYVSADMMVIDQVVFTV